MNHRRAWTISVFLFIFVDTIAVQARGPILSSLESALGVSEAALGLVAPAGTVGFVAAVVAMGLLAGRIRVRRVLFLVVSVTGGAISGGFPTLSAYAVETVPEYSGPLTP